MATFVLVHPAWFGGWCWKKVAPILRGRGHEVFTPTLTGLGERAHLDSCSRPGVWHGEVPFVSLSLSLSASLLSAVTVRRFPLPWSAPELPASKRVSH